MSIEFFLEGGPYHGNTVNLPESVLDTVPIMFAKHSHKNAYLYSCSDPESRTLRYKESFPLDSTQ